MFSKISILHLSLSLSLSPIASISFSLYSFFLSFLLPSISLKQISILNLTLIFLYFWLSFFTLMFNVFFFFSFFSQNQNRMIHYLSEVMTGHKIWTIAFLSYSINIIDNQSKSYNSSNRFLSIYFHHIV